jgi:formylglycine-generating enzyme required for sulfatase activity
MRFRFRVCVCLGIAALAGLCHWRATAADWKTPAEAVVTNSIGIKLVRIQPGEFVMGKGLEPPRSEAEWNVRDWDESPEHTVKIARAFYLGAFEVTNAQYEQFDPAHKELRGRFDVSKGDDEPVTMVSWQQAVDFCGWLSKREGLSKQEGRAYRLPTEAEWEYACRAGTETEYNTGDSLSAEQANIAGKREKTRAVGSYPPNAWGLYDVHGNVEEWCLDWYAPYRAEAQSDPVGPAEGYVRVTRGGSYDVPSWQDDNARYCRSANRSGRLPDDANRCTGFRVVLGEMPATRPTPASEPPLHARDVKQTPVPLTGPDPKQPYFDDFSKRRPTIPDDAWGPIFSKWNHYTACCVCPNGDVLACWYTTKSESGRELSQAASRLTAGTNLWGTGEWGTGQWQPASLFFDVPDVNDHAPVLLSHEGRIYHFASQSLRGWDETSNVLRTSDDNGATWSAPRIIARREGPHNLSQACSAFVAGGTIFLAVDGNGHRTESLLVGSELGKTWSLAAGDLRAAMDDKYAIHPAIAPGKDGSIIAFLRGPDPMPRLVSGDRGESWSACDTPLGGISVGQKAAVLRLESGELLLCANDTRKPPITGERGTLAALSDDDGATWQHVRSLPGVGGYLSAAQAPNGIIYVIGSRMSCAAFNLAWIKEGPAIQP